jgi:hypothetical protein
METVSKKLKAELIKDIRVVEYRELKGLKGIFQWEHIAKVDKFEGKTILAVIGEMPTRLIINGEEYEFKKNPPTKN